MLWIFWIFRPVLSLWVDWLLWKVSFGLYSWVSPLVKLIHLLLCLWMIMLVFVSVGGGSNVSPIHDVSLFLNYAYQHRYCFCAGPMYHPCDPLCYHEERCTIFFVNGYFCSNWWQCCFVVVKLDVSLFLGGSFGFFVDCHIKFRVVAVYDTSRSQIWSKKYGYVPASLERMFL